MMTKYTLSISSNFKNGVINSSKFQQEILLSTITISIDHIDTNGDECDVWFKAELSQSEIAILNSLAQVHDGITIAGETQKVSLDGVSLMSGKIMTIVEKPVSSKLTFITSNWCDKTTWHYDSVYVSNEIAVDSGDHVTYTLAHQYVIDVCHGKITFEDNLNSVVGGTYRVTVKVNDVTKTEQDQHYQSGGDFTVDYINGKIIFLSALHPDDQITVSYHYANNSVYVIKPSNGKKLYIDSCEIQFSDDIVLTDSCIFQLYGLVDVFAPQMMASPFNVPSGTKIPILNKVTYKTIVDFLNDCNAAYPGYPAIGGNNWRALKKQAYVMVWDYSVGRTCLYSSKGMEVRIYMEHNTPFLGTFGNATLYCMEELET